MNLLVEKLLFHFSKKFQTEVFCDYFPLNKDESANTRSIYVRQKMDSFLKAHFGGGDESILDMDNIPQGLFVNGRKLYASISHISNLGVFVICDSHVGVDLEERHRISEAPVKRVCTDAEMALGFEDIKLLWSIKEASFKAIPFAVQPKVISDIQVLKINLEEHDIDNAKTYSFACNLKQDSELKIWGIITCSENYQVAISIILKQ